MGLYFHHQTHSQLSIISALAQPLLSPWSCCSCLPLFPSLAYWMPSDLGGSSCSVISFSLFLLFMVFSRQEYWSWLPFHALVDHFLKALFIMTHPSWVTLYTMADSFTEFWKPLHHYKAVIHTSTKLFDYYSFAVSFENSNGILPYYIFLFWLFGYFGVY